MKNKFEDFQQLYPNLFKTYPRSGFDLPKGWAMIAHNLSEVLEHHIKNLPEEKKQHICVAQIKEKFGTMRFYMTAEDDFISGAIDLAEHMTCSVCEECGQPGEQREGGWIRTLCYYHHVVNILKNKLRDFYFSVRDILER